MFPHSAPPLFLVDAFTRVPYRGNPAVICVLPAWPDDTRLQLVAREMNQSETAFLVAHGAQYELRWFTPQVEVDLCGHATLAAAHALWEQGWANTHKPISFVTRSGELQAWHRGQHIELDFPLEPAVAVDPPAGLLEALQVSAVYVGRNRFDYLVLVEDEGQLRGLSPDLVRLAQVPTRGVIVTCPSADSTFDFVSRFFAPGVGVPEDPVTGSAHCCLGAFWQERLGKSEMTAYQASARGGTVYLRIDAPRILLGGSAVTVSRGCLVG